MPRSEDVNPVTTPPGTVFNYVTRSWSNEFFCPRPL